MIPDPLAKTIPKDHLQHEMIGTVEETLRKGFRLLRFPPALEASFLDFFHATTVKRFRIALLTGIVLYAVFGIDDLLLIPDFSHKTWIIRFGLVCPAGFLILAFSFSPYFKRFMQPAIWTATQVGGLGIIAIIALDPERVGNFHNTGLILVIMYSFTLVGLRFWYGLFWAVTLLCAYLLVVIPSHITPSVLVHNFFNILAAINIGAISNYLMEHYIRRDFLQTILVEAEKKQLQETGRKLQELSARDELTGIANRRHFDAFLEREWQRAHRNQEVLSLILFDIDYFKSYNDTYGHQAGDACLKRVAQEISACAQRPGDLAARYGGEEFVLVLSATDAEHAAALAENCRKRVQGLNISHTSSGPGGMVTLSAGTASVIPGHGLDIKGLIEAADQALYQAKHRGRNQVVAHRNKRFYTPHPLRNRAEFT